MVDVKLVPRPTYTPHSDSQLYIPYKYVVCKGRKQRFYSVIWDSVSTFVGCAKHKGPSHTCFLTVYTNIAHTTKFLIVIVTYVIVDQPTGMPNAIVDYLHLPNSSTSWPFDSFKS